MAAPASAPALRLELLGPFRVLSQHKLVVVPTVKGNALLAYLAASPQRMHHRDRLADLLWCDAGTRARANLRKTLSRIRAALPDAAGKCLISTRTTIAIDLDRVDIDLIEFRADAARDEACARARAIARYRGEFLEGLDVTEPDFVTWLDAERASVRERALGVMRRELAADVAAGCSDKALDLANRMLGIDPYQDHVHHTLIELYLASGRIGAALDQLHRCRDLFTRDFGSVPPWTVNLGRVLNHRMASKVGVRNDSTPARGPHANPFVGRQQELRVLRASLEACIDQSRGGVVFIHGDAGIGKSRLLQEFAPVAAALCYDLTSVEVLNFGVGAYQDPVFNLVCDVLGVDHSASAQKRERAVSNLGLNIHDPAERAVLERLLRLASPDHHRSVLEGMEVTAIDRIEQHILQRLLDVTLPAGAARLLVVEDVHWLDSGCDRHLVNLIQAVEHCACVLVMTTRVVSDTERLGVSAITGCVMTLSLGSLNESEALTLAGHYIDPATPFAARCVSRAKGNPLFLQQLLAGVEDAPSTDIPRSLRSLIHTRVSQLRVSDRAGLAAAAVVGPKFSLALLQHVADNATLQLCALIQHDFLRKCGDECMFTHDLVREAVYDALSNGELDTLHRRAASWFRDRDPMVHAEHLERAGDQAAAASAYLNAALSLNRQYRYSRALQAINRGIRCAATSELTFDLVDLQGVVLRNSGATRECLDAFRLALDTAGDEIQRCRAWIGLAGGLRVCGDVDEANDHLDQAQRVAGDRSLHVALAMIHRLRGNLRFSEGRLQECWAEHNAARRYARKLRLPEHEARTLGGLGDAHYAFGRMVSAHECFQRCIEQSRDLGLRRVETVHRAMRAATRLYLNDLDGSCRDARQAVHDATEIGHPRAEMLAWAMLGDTLYEMADIEQACAAFEQALSIARQLSAVRFQSLFLTGVAHCDAQLGELSRARARARDALKLARQSGMRFNGPAALAALARSSDAGERAMLLSEGGALLNEGCVSHNYYRFYRDAIEISLADRNWHDTRRYAQSLKRYAGREPISWAQYHVARGEALADFGQGRRTKQLFSRIAALIKEGQRYGLRTALPRLTAAAEAGDTGHCPW